MFVVPTTSADYAAVCVIKVKDDALKLCTFKVASEHSGYRYGELLLRASFDHCRTLGLRSCYLTVFEPTSIHHHPSRTGGRHVAESASGRIALISIHPQFAEAIVGGNKRVEFRKTALRSDVNHALIYSTSRSHPPKTRRRIGCRRRVRTGPTSLSR